MKINLNFIGIISLGLLITIGSCKKEEPVQLATLTTSKITSITGTFAISGGNISNTGGADISARGVAWSESPNPTTTNNPTSNGSGTGNYSSNLTGLTANTTYYVRAYATNSAGTAYGNELSFTTTSIPNCGTVTDIDGNVYNTVTIGTQCWMLENLKTTKYRNGDSIPNVKNSNQWSNLTTGAWAHYDNNSQYENSYGKLYNWYAVADPRNVCPTGWHVPTDDEWKVLTDYLVGESVAGGKMKSIGTQYWSSPNTGATNESGFSGLPGGFRYVDGVFSSIGENGNWWSSTEDDTNFAYSRLLHYQDGIILWNVRMKVEGYSVRCIKD